MISTCLHLYLVGWPRKKVSQNNWITLWPCKAENLLIGWNQPTWDTWVFEALYKCLEHFGFGNSLKIDIIQQIDDALQKVYN